MDPSLVRLFLDVARCGSFAAAARDRDVEPSSISRAIARLEAIVGAPLFQRTTRAMTLTEAGALFQARAAQVIADLDRLVEDARSTAAQPLGLLRLSTSSAFGALRLIPSLAKFRTEFPHVQLDLILSDRNLDLVEERIDLAIRFGPTVRSDLDCERLFPTSYRVVASPAYCAAHELPQDPEALRFTPVILLDLPDFRNRWLFQSANGIETEVPVQGALTVSSVLGVRAAAIAGFGPALLADWMIADDIAQGALRDIFPSWRVTATSFDTGAWAVYPKLQTLPRKTSAMLQFLRSSFGPS